MPKNFNSLNEWTVDDLNAMQLHDHANTSDDSGSAPQLIMQRDVESNPGYYVGAKSELTDALTTIGSMKDQIVVTREIVLTSQDTITIPANVTLAVQGQGGFSGDLSGLTINGPFVAPLSHVFNCSAGQEPSLGAGVGVIYPEWFGADSSGVVDATDSINQALSAGDHVCVLKSATFLVSRYVSGVWTNIKLGDNKVFEINGRLVSNATSSPPPEEEYETTEDIDELHPMIINDDQSGGNSNITIFGTGLIDGNRSLTIDEDTLEATLATEIYRMQIGIFLKNVSDSKVMGLAFTDLSMDYGGGYIASGVVLEKSTNGLVANCHVYSIQGTGIQLCGGHNNVTRQNTIELCAEGTGLAFSNFEIENHLPGEETETLLGGDLNRSENDSVKDTSYSAISINMPRSTVIAATASGSLFSGLNIGHPLATSWADETLVVGGIFFDNNFEGVFIYGAVDTRVIGAHIYNNGIVGRPNARVWGNSIRSGFIHCLIEHNDDLNPYIAYPDSSSDWDEQTAYSLGDVVISNFLYYRCISSGTSGETGPSGRGQSISDGSVTWAWVAVIEESFCIAAAGCFLESCTLRGGRGGVTLYSNSYVTWAVDAEYEERIIVRSTGTPFSFYQVVTAGPGGSTTQPSGDGDQIDTGDGYLWAHIDAAIHSGYVSRNLIQNIRHGEEAIRVDGWRIGGVHDFLIESNNIDDTRSLEQVESGDLLPYTEYYVATGSVQYDANRDGSAETYTTGDSFITDGSTASFSGSGFLVRRTTGIGILVVNGKRVTLRGNSISRTMQNGINFRNTTFSEYNTDQGFIEHVAEGNTLIDINAYNIQIEGGDHFIVRNNKMEAAGVPTGGFQPTTRGVYVLMGDDEEGAHAIVDNHIRYMNNHGIDVISGSWHVIQRNNCNNNGGTGIRIQKNYYGYKVYLFTIDPALDGGGTLTTFPVDGESYTNNGSTFKVSAANESNGNLYVQQTAGSNPPDTAEELVRVSDSKTIAASDFLDAEQEFVSNLLIEGNISEENTVSGIEAYDSSRLQLLNNVCRNNTSHGIWFYIGGGESVIRGNQVEANQGRGISVFHAGEDRVKIEVNRVGRNGANDNYGIIAAGLNTHIVDNEVYENVGCGIRIGVGTIPSDGSLVMGNRVWDNQDIKSQTFGIYENSSGDAIRLIGNDVQDATTSYDVDSGAMLIDNNRTLLLKTGLSSNTDTTLDIPEGHIIERIVLRETNGNSAGFISLGTTSGGAQIVTAQTVSANDTVQAALVNPTIAAGSTQSVFISSSSWGSGVVTLMIFTCQL